MPPPHALRETPSQTAGPYVHIGSNPNWAGIEGVWGADLGRDMVGPDTPGLRIVVAGTVFDGEGAPLTDAVVEIWQADAQGRHNADPQFSGWGRQPADVATGRFRFQTIKPGRVAGADGRMMAPHISVWIVARGINIGLHTRLYFADEPEHNAVDPVLGRIASEARRATLLAARDGQSGTPHYTFDIHLQGPSETVFFDI